MSNAGMMEIHEILTLAKQGDPIAIAALINHSLNPRGITAKVGWKNQCLGILLEALPVPDQEEMVAFIRQILGRLQLDSIRWVKVGGYQPGQSVPAWYEEIELEGVPVPVSESTYSPASLTSWLNQGLALSSRDEILTEQTALLPQPSQFPFAINSVISTRANSSTVAPRSSDRRFLRFYFNPEETALLPLTSIQQVLKLPTTEILPVPHMPDCILGIYNWRGEMLWLVDLAQQLGFASVLTDSQLTETMTVLVIQNDRHFLGIAVPRLGEIETHSLQQLQPPTSAFPAKLLSFMQGYFSPSGSPVLNPKALFQDPLLQVHCSD